MIIGLLYRLYFIFEATAGDQIFQRIDLLYIVQSLTYMFETKNVGSVSCIFSLVYSPKRNTRVKHPLYWFIRILLYTVLGVTNSHYLLSIPHRSNEAHTV